MPLQNRVSPFGEIVSDAGRGSFMGNRGGRLHDPKSRTLGPRRWASSRWIICRLAFGGRERTVMGSGYTELFFLDEVTALAAGHRPCFECRRPEAQAYVAAVQVALGLPQKRPAMEIDRMLHAERVAGKAQRRHPADIGKLPDGAMVELEGEAYAVLGSELLEWSFAGYRGRLPRPARGLARLLTPPTSVTALASGYRPVWHKTARPIS